MTENVIGATQAEAAHHEAGHAVVATSLGWDVHHSQIRNLLVEWLGQTDAHGGFPSAIERITVLLGGGAGEARFLGRPDTFPYGCRYEWIEACEIADSGCAGDPEAVVRSCWQDARDRLAPRHRLWLRFAEELISERVIERARCRRLLEIPESAWIDLDVGDH
jgi:hypothetical protein